MHYVYYALLGAIFWALADITTKALMKTGIPNNIIILANSIIALAIVFPVVLMTDMKVSHSYVGVKEVFLLFLNGLLILVGLFFFYISVNKGHVAIASTAMATKIVWTLVFSSLLLKSPLPPPLAVTGIFLVFLGIVLINLSK